MKYALRATRNDCGSAEGMFIGAFGVDWNKFPKNVATDINTVHQKLASYDYLNKRNCDCLFEIVEVKE